MYRKQSRHPSCQLIAAINARIFLGGRDVSDDDYEKLIDIVKCRHNGAIFIDRSYRILGLKHKDGPLPYYGKEKCFDWICNNLPVQITINHPKMNSCHAILVVGFFKKFGYRILNDPCLLTANNIEDIMPWSEIIETLPYSLNTSQLFRSFRLSTTN